MPATDITIPPIFYQGIRANLCPGDLIAPGHSSVADRPGDHLVDLRLRPALLRLEHGDRHRRAKLAV